MSKIHTLKTINPWFQMMLDSKKSFEVRVNDRNYKPGDVLHLREYDPVLDSYSGRSCKVEVLSVTDINDILSMFNESTSYYIVIMSVKKV